ncbi:hypothetical protein [Caulobacter sp. NIBR1757]|uniref:hypothetical protein n=1 Tax=Caulobacter sp. NIBR1757 TaxID=3016000 RepID=UPI0022EFE793|nr:hypothetical protein [Caulobacter sp. NIBR1757]WGM38756.1 hypothetical protein AMEJIAPC_01661 [Caulobacter sp. NIBR1757]
MSGFWRGWFLAWCISIGLFGAVLCGGAFEATSGPIRLLLSTLNSAADPRFDATLRFSLGVMGAVSIGWAVTLAFVVRAALAMEDRARPVWNAITAGMISWFVIDCTLSIATGFGLNVLPNLVLAGMYLVGLIGGGALKRGG